MANPFNDSYIQVPCKQNSRNFGCTWVKFQYFLGDTSDCTQLYHIGQNADILIHEATNENKDMEKSVQNGHSTPSMAVDCAKAMCAKKMILYHLSQRYKPVGEPLKEGELSVECLLEEAKSSFDNVEMAFDFLTVNVPVNN